MEDGEKRSNRTFMELKLWSKSNSVKSAPVLIAPLWNWNLSCNNCIIWLRSVLIAPLWNWNITSLVKAEPSGGSNRTFMELKSRESNPEELGLLVLIAPLWNWNPTRQREYPWWYPRSNRTFMELKYKTLSLAVNVLRGSNRTFMELKWTKEAHRLPPDASSNRTFMELK